MRAIDGNELLGIERLLDTDIVRKSKTASWLLDQVLHDIRAMPTLTPQNELANRLRELDELYTKLHAVTGFTAEQLLEMFAAGYTPKKPDYSKSMKELADLEEITPQNEALTIEQLREMKDEPAYLEVFDPLLQSGWHIVKAVTEDKIIFRGWQTVYVPIDSMGTDYNLYRRPPERQGGDADHA